MDDCCRTVGDSIHIEIKALPGASKTEFAGVKDGRLRVRVAAAPEGGKANAELVSFLAKALGCPARDVALLRGEKTRLKTLALPLACEVKLKKALGEIMS
jgi:uncharacterized protein (TIGR00251 family)